MKSSGAFQEFLRKAAYYHHLPNFECLERDYKFRLAKQLRTAADAMRDGTSGAVALLVQALRSRDNNLIAWQDRDPLIGWVTSDSLAEAAILRLWDPMQPLDTRLRHAEGTLHAAGLSKPGSKLTVVSTLLMAISPVDHPPVRTEPFRKVLSELGSPNFASGDDLPARYHKAMALLDDLVASCGTLLRDRLDAQSVVWCAYSKKWPAVPADYSLPNDIDPVPTEHVALRLARRGQGRFQDGLLDIWGRCAVTQCGVRELIEAAHIKPWSASTDTERLDPHNGLLLVPTIHAALDARLITFDPDDGTLIVSDILRKEDAVALGLRPGMRLSKIPERTRVYLRYHADAFRARQSREQAR
jgi:hypothetical protein